MTTPEVVRPKTGANESAGLKGESQGATCDKQKLRKYRGVRDFCDMRTESGQPKPGFSPPILPYSNQQLLFWTEFLKEFWEWAVRYAHARCRNFADAEEVVSEAIEKAATTYNGTGNRKTWLTWKLRGAITKLRRNDGQWQPIFLELAQEVAETPRSIEVDTFLNLEERERRGFLAKALRSLSKQERRLFWLRTMRGLEYDDIFKRPAITRGCARVKVYRATKQVRQILLALLEGSQA